MLLSGKNWRKLCKTEKCSGRCLNTRPPEDAARLLPLCRKVHVFGSAKCSQKSVNIQEAAVVVESSWNVMAHGDTREGKWRGNWRIEWVASTLHTTSEDGVSSITTADAHTAASSRLNWSHSRFKLTSPYCRKTETGFCACATTFQKHSTDNRPHMLPESIRRCLGTSLETFESAKMYVVRFGVYVHVCHTHAARMEKSAWAAAATRWM